MCAKPKITAVHFSVSVFCRNSFIEPKPRTDSIGVSTLSSVILACVAIELSLTEFIEIDREKSTYMMAHHAPLYATFELTWTAVVGRTADGPSAMNCTFYIDLRYAISRASLRHLFLTR